MKPNLGFSRNKTKLSGLRVVTFLMALVPLLVLLLIIFNLVSGSKLAVQTAGWNLFSTSFTPGTGSFGLLPAIWGTALVVIVAMILAVPAALFLAILANDFTAGFLGSAVRWSLGILSGIPPVVYAAMTPVFFNLFIWPKFAGKGLAEAALLSMQPRENLPLVGSTLLGAILLALLIIPFLAPLIDDAIKTVPHSHREASFSLGANRWQTMINITLPEAISGISSAIVLGVLTAIGESIIVAFAIGFQINVLPDPLFDILKHAAPLTCAIVEFSANGFTRAGTNPTLRSVGNVASLLLLFVAFVFLALSTYLQSRFKRRFQN